MAKKPTTKTKKTEKKRNVAEDSVVNNEEHTEEIIMQNSAVSIPSSIPIREMTVTESKPVEEKCRYRFFSTVSRLNISNVIFDNMRVVVYETVATSKEDAIFDFTTRIQDRFNGNVVDSNKFITAVFGSKDNIILETISVNNITEEKITL